MAEHRIFVRRDGRPSALPWRGRCTCGTQNGSVDLDYVMTWVSEHIALSATLVPEGSQGTAPV